MARIACGTLWFLFVMFSTMQIARPGWGFTVIPDTDKLIGYGEISLFLALCVIVFVGVAFWDVYTVRRRLSENDLLLCTNCGYSLLGLPTNGRCPECGTIYESGNVRYIWGQFFGEHTDRGAHERPHDNDGSKNFSVPLFRRWRQNTAVAFALHAKSMPRILRRGMWIHKVVVVPLALLVLLSTVYELWLEYALLVLGLGALAVVALVYRHVSAIRRRVEANGGALCTKCGSSLVAQAAQEKCIVCGVRYDLDQVRSEWSQLFARCDRKSLGK